MSSVQDKQRAKVVALAEILTPLIDQHFAAPVPPPPAPRDERLLQAAEKVAEAVSKLQQVKFTRAEISARRRLECEAIALMRLTMKLKKGRRHVG